MARGPSATGAAATYPRIYAVVRRIPKGRVATYGQVAAVAGLAGHARQVGYALHALGFDAKVPWHRVLNARGEVSPRAEGDGAGYQRFLLEEEDVVFSLAGRVDLEIFGWQPDQAPARGGRAAQVRAQVERILDALRPLGAPERAAGARAYLKSELEFFGVDTPALRRAARAWLADRRMLPRGELTALAAELWRRPQHEARAFAMELLMARQELLAAADLRLLETLLRRSGSWAYVDALAIHVVGPLVERHPELEAALDRWAVDGDFWIRRSALLAPMRPLGRAAAPSTAWRRWTRRADPMLGEREFFIRKALGWVLREVGKRHPRRVADYLARRLGQVSPLTLREGVKYLPDEVRSRLQAPARAAAAGSVRPRSRS